MELMQQPTVGEVATPRALPPIAVKTALVAGALAAILIASQIAGSSARPLAGDRPQSDASYDQVERIRGGLGGFGVPVGVDDSYDQVERIRAIAPGL
jgi:hypothetical protein